jgi:SAM-dependent methyltransferase
LPAAFPEASRWILDPKPAAVSFQQAQWGALPYAQEKVDLVFAGSVFTHLLPDAAEVALRSIASSLAPNGLAVLTAHAAPTAGRDWVVHSRTEETALPELEDSLARTAYSSVSFSDDAWIELLKRNGFTDIHKKDVLFGGTQVIWAARKT